jgi:hypothetical protein
MPMDDLDSEISDTDVLAAIVIAERRSGVGAHLPAHPAHQDFSGLTVAQHTELRQWLLFYSGAVIGRELAVRFVLGDDSSAPANGQVINVESISLMTDGDMDRSGNSTPYIAASCDAAPGCASTALDTQSPSACTTVDTQPACTTVDTQPTPATQVSELSFSQQWQASTW